MTTSTSEEGHTQLANMPSLTEMSGEDYKKEALVRAAKERLDIVNKYKKGEDSENEEDNWMDANSRVYKVTDRYGFLHAEALPDTLDLIEEKRKQTEVKRQYKWVKMIQKWDLYVGTEKLRQRVYKGIPLNLRGDAWRLMLNVENLMQKEPSAYQEMRVRSHDQSPDIKQIDMDVNRTYRDHIMFRSRYSTKQQQLFDVLSAYSMYNTEVGYCQGMSQIAALLLMYMNEEEAFWALHSLLYGKKHLMHGFFIPGFPKLMRFQEHHDKILKKMMPKLKKHLDQNEIFASLYTMKWFFQCFLDRSPFPLTLRLWDIYVLEGERLLTAMSYTTLKMHKGVIKKMDMDEICRFLQEQLAADFGADDDAVVEQLRVNMNELRRSGMDLPPPPGDDEKPKLPFGQKIEPTFEQETGLRSPSQSVKAKPNSTNVTSFAKSKAEEKSSKSRKTPAPSTNGKVDGTSSGRRTSRQSSTRRKEEEGKQKSKKKDKKDKSRRGSRRESIRKQQEAPKQSSDEVSTLNTDKNGHKSTEQKADKSPDKKAPVPRIQIPSSTDYISSSTDSHPNNNFTPSPVSSEGKGRLLWKTPAPNKITPSTNQQSPSAKSSPIKWLPTSDDVGSPDGSREHTVTTFTKSKSAELSAAQKPKETTRPSSFDHPPHGAAQSNYPPHGAAQSNYPPHVAAQSNYQPHGIVQSNYPPHGAAQSNYPPHVAAQSNYKPHGAAQSSFDPTTSLPHHFTHQSHPDVTRPFSIYDNVQAGMLDSEDDVIDDDVWPPLPPPALHTDDGSDFEAKMEESLENLRELTAGLSRTPSPLAPHPADRRAPLVNRSVSLDPLNDVIGRSVTKSSSSVQLSTFQQAIQHAKILDPLPTSSFATPRSQVMTSRPPLTTSRSQVITSRPEMMTSRSKRRKASWGETNLDGGTSLRHYVDLHSSGVLRHNQHSNNNNRMTSSVQRRDVPPGPWVKRGFPPGNIYSRHNNINVIRYRDVTPPHDVTDRFVDVTRFSPEHSPQPRGVIRHQMPEVAPPPYTSRGRHYVIGGDVRRGSSSVAIQTEVTSSSIV